MEKARLFLKSVRQEKGISIAEVSKSTKISPSIIRAIEEGSVDGIDQVYLRGFLKLYCRFLGIDWDKFIKDYPAVSTDRPAYKTIPAKEAGGDFKSSTTRFFSEAPKVTKIALIFLSLVAAVLMITLLSKGCVSVGKKIKQIDFKGPAKISAASGSTQIKTTQSQPKKAQDVKVHPGPVERDTQIAETVRLGIFLKEDSFVKVTLDGKPVYQGMLRKGKKETWVAKDKIELSVGNAAGIELETDGKIYSSLGRRGQPIKRIIIDRQGLKTL